MSFPRIQPVEHLFFAKTRSAEPPGERVFFDAA